MRKIMKIGILCLVFSLVMLIVPSAATLGEMYENGVVSDDGIRLGDARDGEVSDVSEGSGILNGESTGMLGDMMGSDTSSKENNGVIPDMTNAPSTTNSTLADTSGNKTDGEGIGMGVIIAVAVVIAVIVIIFLLLPKRK